MSAPRYLELAQQLRRLVESLEPGDPIPAERLLAEKYQVSRMTARKAIYELVAQGVLDRHVGRGTFVSRPSVRIELALSSFSAEMASRGLTAGSQILSCRLVQATEVGIAAFESVELVELRRLRTADEMPVAVETAYLRSTMVPGLLAHITQVSSLYELLNERYKITLVDGEQDIWARACPRDVALLLGIPAESAVFWMERTSFFQGQVVEFTRSVYRGDQYRLRAQLSAARAES